MFFGNNIAMIRHFTPSGSAAYHNSLHVAAHLSMCGSASSKRYSVWFVPTGGVGRGLAEADPKHKAAVKHALKECGELGCSRARWSDTDGEYTVQEA